MEPYLQYYLVPVHFLVKQEVRVCQVLLVINVAEAIIVVPKTRLPVFVTAIHVMVVVMSIIKNEGIHEG